MPAFPPTDALGFEILLPTRRHLGAVILRTLAIGQLIAVPVALVMTSVGGNLVGMLVVATVYSQLIALCCGLTSPLTIEWLDAQTAWRGQAGVMAQYFACGVAGAEMARRTCYLIYGSGFNAGPPYVSWAIGATIALLVGGIMHGIATGVAGGSVRVRGWREGDLVHVTVVNTGSGEGQPEGTGEGLESVRRRLRATFGARSSLTLKTAPGATEARVTFPVRTP